MSIEGKHAYRFGYLQSEQWQIVRSAAMARDNACCVICRDRSFSNDAHHIHYPESVWDTKADDLVILCRECHALVHAISQTHKDRKEAFKQFGVITSALKEWLRTKTVVRKKKGLPRIVDGIMRCMGCRQLRTDVLMRELFPDNPKDNSKWAFCPGCWIEMQKRTIKTYAGARFVMELLRKRNLKKIVDANVKGGVKAESSQSGTIRSQT